MLTSLETTKISVINKELAICFENVRIAYGSLVALADINLDINKGEIEGI